MPALASKGDKKMVKTRQSHRHEDKMWPGTKATCICAFLTYTQEQDVSFSVCEVSPRNPDGVAHGTQGQCHLSPWGGRGHQETQGCLSSSVSCFPWLLLSLRMHRPAGKGL